MKKLALLLLSFAVLSACNAPQAEASAAYIAAEAATAALISKTPALLPVVNSLTADWNAYQGGHLSAAQEATLLQQIVTATGNKLNPTEAALLDGAVQQILANQNTTAPTPLTGAAGAIVTTVINGAARAAFLATPPTS